MERARFIAHVQRNVFPENMNVIIIVIMSR